MVVLQLCPMRCIAARCGGDDIYHCMLSMLKQSGDEASHVRCCWAPDAVCGPDKSTYGYDRKIAELCNAAMPL